MARNPRRTVMVLYPSGSMADDGAGRTRVESARRAVDAVVDALPDGYPIGLRVYGADRTSGCADTRLVRPVEALDRDAVKRAGPEHGAPVRGAKAGGGTDDGSGGEAKYADKKGNPAAAGDSSGGGGAGWTGIAVAAGAGALVGVAGGFLSVRSRRRAAMRMWTTRGSA